MYTRGSGGVGRKKEIRRGYAESECNGHSMFGGETKRYIYLSYIDASFDILSAID